MDFAFENNLTMIDLYPILLDEHNSGKKVYNSNEQHWTAEGNRIVAETLKEFILGSKLIGN